MSGRRERRAERALQAYHDGELSGLARRRFERRLRHSPELQRELEDLRQLGRELRALDARSPTPDLWSAISRRLPVARPAPSETGAAWWRERWWAPLGAAAVAAGIVLALVIGRDNRDTATGFHGGVVQWVNSGNRGLMVLEGDDDLTVIWVFDEPAEGTGTGGTRGAA